METFIRPQQVSEAFSLVIPIIMSKFADEGFGVSAYNKIGCVGESKQGMKNFILYICSYEGI